MILSTPVENIDGGLHTKYDYFEIGFDSTHSSRQVLCQHEGAMQEEKEVLLWEYAAVIASETEKAGQIMRLIQAELKKRAWADHDIFGIHLAAEEALQNAIKHGNGCDPEKCVRVTCHATQIGFKMIVRDEGAGFDPAAVPNCTDDDRLEVPSGRGLLLMNSFMDSIIRNDVGNEVTMYKKRTVALATA